MSSECRDETVCIFYVKKRWHCICVFTSRMTAPLCTFVYASWVGVCVYTFVWACLCNANLGSVYLCVDVCHPDLSHQIQKYAKHWHLTAPPLECTDENMCICYVKKRSWWHCMCLVAYFWKNKLACFEFYKSGSRLNDHGKMWLPRWDQLRTTAL